MAVMPGLDHQTGDRIIRRDSTEGPIKFCSVTDQQWLIRSIQGLYRIFGSFKKSTCIQNALGVFIKNAGAADDDRERGDGKIFDERLYIISHVYSIKN
jgi:hypothetical protein